MRAAAHPLRGADVGPPLVRGRSASQPRRALRERRTQVGLAITSVMLLVAVAGPWVAPHAPTEFVGAPSGPPGADAVLGTDYLGHDVLSGVLNGGRTVIWMALVAATIGTALGVCMGLAAGYVGGKLDTLLMRVIDVVLAFPQVVLVLLFVSMLGSSPALIVLLVGVAWAPQVARVTRGLTLDVATREFVEAVEIMGVSRIRILRREILPNLATPLLVEYGLRITWSIAAIAAISFLGLGIRPPSTDWGLMINQNRTGLVAQPWAVLVPVFCIGLFTVGTNLMTEGLSRAVGLVSSRRR